MISSAVSPSENLEAQLAKNLFPAWPGVIFRQRTDFTFESVTPRIEELTGVPLHDWAARPDLFWQTVHESDAEALRKQLQQCLQGPAGVQSAYRIRHRQTGRITYVSEYRRAALDGAGELLHYDGFWLDVTRQTIAERRLATASWKETLAVLTMGLAHDFNNVLAGILSLSESFLAQIETDHPFQEGLSLIKCNAQQASQLVHRIIHLHYGKIGNRSYHDLNDIVSDAVELLRKVIPRRIEVQLVRHPAPMPLYVDAVDFRQVIINMALNAADAMPDRGELIFRTAAHTQAPPLRHYKGLVPRLPCACLSVEDNGCGIKTARLQSIFDPFFTTKAMNKGSGLGLYNARLFVEKHQGAISVESTEGTGTTFGIWLPQTDFGEEGLLQEPFGKRRRSILLVGNAGKSLASMAEFLRSQDYHVVAVAGTSEEALQSTDYHFDAVMAQVEARDSDALSLVELARNRTPPLKLILQIVGCNEDELETQFLLSADLRITADMSQEIIGRKLQSLFGNCPAEPA